MIKFNEGVLRIKCDGIARRIEDFIKCRTFIKFRKKGIVIGLSGGIDSSVVAVLAVRALGRDKVTALLLPERESSPESGRYARILADRLGIRAEKKDISSTVEEFGAYADREKIVKKYAPGFNRKDKFRVIMPPGILETDQLNIPFLEVRYKNGKLRRELLSSEDYLAMIAATNIKQRARMMMLYHYAEKNNYAVAGTTNFTELYLGFFVKYGDGAADIEPISHLYKTQVYKLARYLKIPLPILDRAPTPDTFSYAASDEELFFRLPYGQLDLLLYAMLNGVPVSVVEKNMKIPAKKLKRIFLDFKSKHRTGEYLMGSVLCEELQ